jgi:hypothetical protein
MSRAGAGVVLAVTGMLLAAGGAQADHNTIERMSTGPTGGNGAQSAVFRGAAADGSRVVFQTPEKLVGTDTDAATDVYERAGGATTLLSTGPSGGNGAFGATFAGISPGGARVVFRTAEPLVTGDTDAAVDLYERAGGVTTLVSTGPFGGNADFNAIFEAMSQDGSRIFFSSDERLTSNDNDNESDIYERAAGTTTLISTGPADANLGVPATFAGLSRDGTRVFFVSDEPLASSDVDNTQDVYERAGGITTHLSIGPAGGNGNEDLDYDATFDGASADGTKVWLHTDETLTADDTDAANDIYQRSGAAIARVSTGAAGGNGAAHAFFDGASDDGSRVFFDTQEALTAGDTDASTDVYERAAGTTTLLSAGGNGPFFSAFEGASADGARVIFQTAEPLVAADTDTYQDVYRREGGTTTLISTGPQGGNGAFPASFRGASRDGWRVFFETSEHLVPAAGGTYPDLYERAASGTTLISTGPLGGAGSFFAFFAFASDDGTRVFFETAEALAPGDTDSSQDVYMSSSALGYVRPKGALTVRASLVPAFNECTAPNRTHGPGLAFPSCNPPAQASSYLTVGTPDVNGEAANSSGSVKLQALPGIAATPADEADVRIQASLSDVRRRTTGLPDYTGELQLDLQLRITDKLNGSTPTDFATVADLPFAVTVACAATAATTTGATCGATTTADAVVPGAVTELKRTMWEVGRIAVRDGGADSTAATTSGNGLFATQGLLVP